MLDTLPLGVRSLSIFVVSAVMLGLAIIAVAMRCFVRLYIVRAFGWDDGLMLLALALFIALSVLCMIGPLVGIGHEMKDFKSLASLEHALLVWWLGQMLYIWASAVSKVAIALALLRLAVKRRYRIILWSIIGVVITIGLVFWLVLLFDCKPVSYFWQQVTLLTKGKCMSTDVLISIAYMYSSITIVCDFGLGILPACLIWGLQMTHRTKAALVGILSLGAIASVAVVIRLPYLKHYADREFLYSTYQIAIWSVMETGLAIIAGSLITLRPLFRWFLDGSSSYRRRRRSGPSGGKYALSNLTADASKPGSHEPRYWRPDVGEESTNVVVTSVSAQMGQGEGDNSSQEDLNPTQAPRHKNQVSVHKTFVVSDSEHYK